MYISYYANNQFVIHSIYSSTLDHLVKHKRVTLYAHPGSRVYKPHNILLRDFAHWAHTNDFCALLNSTPSGVFYLITLPIYYTKHLKTKAPKTIFVGMNWYRNAYYSDQNEVKQHFHQLVLEQTSTLTPTQDPFKLELAIYYKNPTCDGSNIAAMSEKFVLDALQSAGIIPNDNVRYHLGSTWTIAGQDRLNPRVDITLVTNQNLP